MINVQQITAKLRMMPDQMLQKYAMQNKNDPYTVSLALSESNTRKQMRTAAQARTQEPPKVVDQDIAGMAAVDPMGNVTGALPEDMGIGRLPAPNMAPIGRAEGGIIGFAGGGEVEHFRRGGASEDDAFNQAFLRTLKYEGGRTNDTGGDTKYGISKKNNPDVDIDKLTIEGARKIYKDRYWNAISGDKLAARDPKFAQAAFDTAVNQGVSKAKQFVTESGGDVSKLMQLRGEHYDNLVQKNPEKYGAYAKGWAARLGNLATDLAIPSAIAGEVPRGTPATPAGAPKDMGPGPGEKLSADGKTYVDAMGIPTRSVGTAGGQSSTPAPTETGFLSPEWFQEKAEGMGLSRDVGRNVYNTMMAPTPLAPASQLPKTPGYLSKAYHGIAGLGEKAYNKIVPSGKMSEEGLAALQAKRAEEAVQAASMPPRLTPPAAPLKEGSATIPVTKTGQGVVQSAEDLEKLRLANQAADQLAATKAAEAAVQGPSAAEKLQNASYIREADEAARLQNAAKSALNTKANLAATQIPAELDTSGGKPDLEALDKELPIDQTGIEALKKKESEAATDKRLAEKGGLAGLFNDPALLMGLQLMASKNPNFLGGVGEAGLGTAKHLAEQRESEAKQNYQTSMGKYYQSYADAVERGAKEKNLELEAEKLVINHMDKWGAGPGKMATLQDPKAAAIEEARARTAIYGQLGLKPATMGGQAQVPPPASGWGPVKVR